MIDKLIIDGMYGPFQQHHLDRLAQVSYARFLQSKTKPTTTFINSPLTGAQIEVLHEVKNVAGIGMGYLQISIPVASALIGHNYFHAGLEVLRHEIKCVELLVKVLLVGIGLNPEEIHRFMKMAKIILAEATWHTPTANVRARKACQSRTIEHMKAKRELSSRHDVQVSDALILDSKSGVSMFVQLKSDDHFRQYCKSEQIQAQLKKPRNDSYVSKVMRQKLASILTLLDSQVRNEIIVGKKTLISAGIRHPRDMHPESFEKAMLGVWGGLGFGRRQVDRSKLSNSAKDTLQRFEAGEDVMKTLPDYRVSRDRAMILANGGPDILEDRTGLRFKSAHVGKQLQYPRRWPLPDELRDLAVSERTAPAIMLELQQGLDFVTDGVLPDIADPVQATAWRQRWMAFARAEHLCS